MVGREIHMDPAISAQVLSAEAGTKIRVDSDGDSRIDCIYFIDTDDRHQNTRSPLLVKIIDELNGQPA